MRRRSRLLAYAPSGLSPAVARSDCLPTALRSLLSALSRMDCTTMTHLPPSGFNSCMATGRGTRASRFSSACAHCFSRDVRRFLCAFAYYYPRNANHIFRREIFRFRAAFAVSPLALSRSLAVSVFKEHRRSFPIALSGPRITCDTSCFSMQTNHANTSKHANFQWHAPPQ